MENKLFGLVKVVNMVHDEIMVECDADLADEIAVIVQESMEKAGVIFCKTIPLKATPMITDYWEH